MSLTLFSEENLGIKVNDFIINFKLKKYLNLITN